MTGDTTPVTDSVTQHTATEEFNHKEVTFPVLQEKSQSVVAHCYSLSLGFG
jgi:hypothetical protein